MSGYDNSPDYGDPEPTRKEFWIWLVCMLIVLALIA
jgi:hypothetical protein